MGSSFALSHTFSEIWLKLVENLCNPGNKNTDNLRWKKTPFWIKKEWLQNICDKKHDRVIEVKSEWGGQLTHRRLCILEEHCVVSGSVNHASFSHFQFVVTLKCKSIFHIHVLITVAAVQIPLLVCHRSPSATRELYPQIP